MFVARKTSNAGIFVPNFTEESVKLSVGILSHDINMVKWLSH